MFSFFSHCFSFSGTEASTKTRPPPALLISPSSSSSWVSPEWTECSFSNERTNGGGIGKGREKEDGVTRQSASLFPLLLLFYPSAEEKGAASHVGGKRKEERAKSRIERRRRRKKKEEGGCTYHCFFRRSLEEGFAWLGDIYFNSSHRYIYHLPFPTTK